MLIVEIGFGNGQFLLNLARQKADTNLIGVEMSLPSIRKAEARLVRHAVENVRLVRADARNALWLLFNNGAIDHVFLNFPDPWPKEAHHRRRIIQPAFLDLLAYRMALGAKLDIATDHLEYANWIDQCLQNSRYLQSCFPVAYRIKSKEELRTKYERKALNAGQSYYHFQWEKNRRPDHKRFQVLKESPMPHVVLSSEMSLEDIARRLNPKDQIDGEIVVRYQEVLLSRDNPAVAIETYIADNTYEQQVLLALAKRSDDSLLVHLKETGHPRPTPAVAVAIRRLTEAVLELDSSAELINHNLGFDLNDW